MRAMIKNIQTILLPFLIISYIFGLRIANLSSYAKLWLSVLYMLVIWSVYYFFLISELIFIFGKFLSFEDQLWLEIFVNLLSIMFGVYYDKKFQKCLEKLDIIDYTLLKLGTMINNDKLCKKTVLLVLGWFMMFILITYGSALLLTDEYDYDIAKAIFFIFLRDYSFHINFIGDLTTASILEYIGFKFDQVNEQLQNLMNNNKHKIKQAWENSIKHQHQRRFLKVLNSKCIMWTVIHLHLELRKISCEIDSIFGTQMTFKMLFYFGWIVADLRKIVCAILNNNFVKSKIMFVTIQLLVFSHNVFKFLLVNYMCEAVIIKANTTADLLNRLSYLTYDIEIREFVLQFSLRIVHAPLKFCGIGFFQFGFKFLYKFIASIATVLIIIIQAEANK